MLSPTQEIASCGDQRSFRFSIFQPVSPDSKLEGTPSHTSAVRLQRQLAKSARRARHVPPCPHMEESRLSAFLAFVMLRPPSLKPLALPR
jgi:hypothetical protein